MKIQIDKVITVEWNEMGLILTNTHTKQRMWLTPKHAIQLKEFLDDVIKERRP